MANLKVTSVVLQPAQVGEQPGMPTFLVSGTWRGKPFSYKVSTELDGRDVEWEHVSGVDPQSKGSASWDEEQETVYEAIFATSEYQAAGKTLYGQ